MMASLLLSRILGTGRDIVIAAMFGQNLATDAYRISFQVPDLIFFLVAGGALSSAFIPVFSEYWHTDRQDDAWHVFSSVTCIMSLALIAVIGLAWAFAPALAHIVCGPKQDAAGMVAMMSRIILPAQFAFFIGGLMFGTLYARQVFAVPGLGPNVYNLGIIGGAILLGHVLQPGVMGMSWGALAGAILGNLLIPGIAMRRMGMRFRWTLDTRHPGVRKVFRLMLPVILGLSLPGVYALILQYFATYYGPGVNTALDSANRLMQAPLGVFGQSLALAVFPALTQFFAQNRMDAFRAQLASTLRTVIYLTMPVTALLIAMPGPIIRALLQHGNFTVVDTARTAPPLQMFSIGVAAWCLHPVLMRAYFSLQKNVKPIVMGTFATLVFIGFGWIVIRLGKGFEWLALGGSVSAILLVAAMLLDLRSESKGLDVMGIVATVWKAALASVPVGLIAWSASAALSRGHVSTLFYVCGVAGIGFATAWLYIFLTRAFKMPEASYVDRAMRKLNRKKDADESSGNHPRDDGSSPDAQSDLDNSEEPALGQEQLAEIDRIDMDTP